jgi:hypothetical protein
MGSASIRPPIRSTVAIVRRRVAPGRPARKGSASRPASVPRTPTVPAIARSADPRIAPVSSVSTIFTALRRLSPENDTAIPNHLNPSASAALKTATVPLASAAKTANVEPARARRVATARTGTSVVPAWSPTSAARSVGRSTVPAGFVSAARTRCARRTRSARRTALASATVRTGRRSCAGRRRDRCVAGRTRSAAIIVARCNVSALKTLVVRRCLRKTRLSSAPIPGAPSRSRIVGRASPAVPAPSRSVGG